MWDRADSGINAGRMNIQWTNGQPTYPSSFDLQSLPFPILPAPGQNPGQ